MLGGVPAPVSSGPRAFPRAFGDYELLGEIARGGMGVVYRARQVTLDRVVALKVILSSHLASPDFVERFRVEARSAAGLDHPNIVPIYEIGEHAGEPFFSMKLVEGETLAARNARVWRRGATAPGPAQIRSAIELVVALARAVHYAHQRGVLHRDIKPNNILLDPGDTPYLTDFGLAKLLDADSGVTRTSAVLGTPSYMSPEQARGETRRLTMATDVYGLGAVLYELLTGRPPFAGGTSVETIRMVLEEEPRPLTRFHPALDSDLETICLKCLEKSPAARYSSAGELADDLERWMRHEPIVARPASAAEKLRKWVRRRPGQALAGASAIMALLIVTVVSTVAAVRMNKARRSAEEANLRLEHHLRDMQWDRAKELASSGRTDEALAYLARLVRTSPDPAIPAARIASMLNLRSFPLPRGEPMRHAREISDMAFSPSGGLLATASFDNTVAVWSVKDQGLEAALSHPVPVTAVEFHPSGELLLAAAQDGEAFLWDIASREVRHRFQFNPIHNPHPKFSRDGRWIALRTGLRAITVFETDTGEIALGPIDMGSRVRFQTFLKDEDALLVGTSNGAIRLHELPSGRVLPPEINLSNSVAVVTLTPDGRKIISGELRRVAVWDRATGALEREIFTGASEVIKLSASPDGKRILSVSYLETPRIWEIDTGRPLSPPFTGAVNFVEGHFSPDGNQIVLASTEGAALVLDGHDGRPLLEPAHHSGAVVKALFSPDGTLIATATEDGVAQFWDVRMGELKRTRFPGLTGLREAALSPDGQFLFTSSEHVIQRRSAAAGGVDGPPMIHEAAVFMAQVSPDGKMLASVAYDRAGHRWDLETFQELQPPLAHQDHLTFLAFSPDSRILLTMSEDRAARLWDASSGTPLTGPLLHARVPLHGNFHPDGSRFLTTGFDGTVRVWTSPEGRLLFETQPHDARVWQARFSPDGRLIASASADRTVRLWDAGTGEPVGRPILHRRGVLAVRFRSDGAALVSATEDGTVRVWDARTGQPISRPMRHADMTWNVAFSSDGQRLLTGSYDGTARIWDAGTGYPISDPLPHSGNVIRALFSPDEQRVITTSSDGVLSFWDARVIQENVPSWFPDFVESLAGKRLNEKGELENAPVLAPPAYLFERETRPDAYQQWVRSFLIDRVESSEARSAAGGAGPEARSVPGSRTDPGR
jgi:WD40 repeat protein